MSARYAIRLSCCLPGDLPSPDSYPFSTDKSDEWYAVVAVHEGELAEAKIEDVRRSDWEVPEGVVDWRKSHV